MDPIPVARPPALPQREDKGDIHTKLVKISLEGCYLFQYEYPLEAEGISTSTCPKNYV